MLYNMFLCPPKTQPQSFEREYTQGCGALLQAALVVSGAWPATFHIVLQLLSPALPRFSSDAVQVTEKFSNGWPHELPMAGRQPNICPVLGENPTGGRQVEKLEEGLFSLLQNTPVFKARGRGPILDFFELLSLFCIIYACVPLRGV